MFWYRPAAAGVEIAKAATRRPPSSELTEAGVLQRSPFRKAVQSPGLIQAGPVLFCRTPRPPRPANSSPPSKRIFGHPARRCHRVRQDRGVFRSDRCSAAGGRQVIVLLPEIALTADWLDRFQQRFGTPPLVWHSDVPMPNRRNWRAVLRGEAKLVVGARSLMHLSRSRADRHRRERPELPAGRASLQRPRHGGGAGTYRRVPVILASATPSLETVDNVRRGKYRRLSCQNGSPRVAADDPGDRHAQRRWIARTGCRPAW